VDRIADIESHSQPSLAQHWPEYAAEALGLGLFMVAAGVVATLLESPHSLLREWLPNDLTRRVLGGLAMGVTAIGLIYSPWGKRSGAHLNPSVTLTFLRLGKIRPADAALYIVAQFVGGLAGVLLVLAVLGDAFSAPPVSYAATVPGTAGAAAAFVAEFAISAGMMFVVLHFAEQPELAAFTGVAAGVLVAIYIAVESPFSGMSMNPARTFASAAPGALWQHLWLYFAAPPLGMLAAAQLHLALHGAGFGGCAKLIHSRTTRCIHCGFEPAHERAERAP
jgi:aquaporin Z